jgi:transketolase
MKNIQLNQALYRKLANCIRILTIDAVQKANSGHPGMPMGMADVATVLFADFLKFNPNDPKWPNRDRFILSAGHGSMLLYSLLYLTGYKDISIEDIKNFRQLHSKTPGHPEYGSLEGIECTTGPLGQGLGSAVGMALAQKIQSEKLGKDVITNHTYVIVGDGCLMEGISHEAASLAGHLKLNKLIVLFDSNNITIDGERSLSDSENTLERFKSYNWTTYKIDGHNFSEIHSAIEKAQTSDKPVIIQCNTVIGFGSPHKAGKSSSHGSPLGEKEALMAKQNYGWDNETPFYIPNELLDLWRNRIGAHSQGIYENWKNILYNQDQDKINEIKSLQKPQTLETAEESLIHTKSLFTAVEQESTRVSSRKVIEGLQKYCGNLYGGSSDLSESNCTKTSTMSDINSNNFKGNYINYGVREHAMGAIMNGMSLYGGMIPYGGTFLVFSDYAKPAIRMSALMKQRVIYIMTHDSIGLGEDGPTHHPVEQLANLRAIPNLNVLRPADGIETAECWNIAITNTSTPSVLCLTRQSVRQIRNRNTSKEINLCQKGAYILSESQHDLSVTIIATGSEVNIALSAQKSLEELNIGTRVISMPCSDIFDQQPQEYKNTLLSNSSLKVGIEAAVRQGWDKYIGNDGIFIGMNGFGESAPAHALYDFFGITQQNIVDKILALLKINKDRECQLT